jgi:hypothetical protein
MVIQLDCRLLPGKLIWSGQTHEQQKQLQEWRCNEIGSYLLQDAEMQMPSAAPEPLI